MKVLAFDADLSKIDQVGQALASSPNLAVSSSSRGNLEITHSDAQKALLISYCSSIGYRFNRCDSNRR